MPSDASTEKALPTMANQPLQLLQQTTGLLLVGGLGTRLRAAVSDRPKAMALIAGKPFLEYQLEWLREAGIRECVLAIGYRGKMVQEYFGDGSAWGLRLIYSTEDRPLGTWGAIRQAQPWLHDRAFLVLNGDSWLPMRPLDLLQTHLTRQGCATLTITRTEDCARFGTVEFDETRQILAFREKQGTAVPGWINAGVYAFSPAVFDLAPVEAASLETEVLPLLISHRLCAHLVSGSLIDIGLPADYWRLNQNVEEWREAIRGSLQPRP